MPTEDPPDRTPAKPQKHDHQFETPVVHESRSGGSAAEEPRPSAVGEQQPPPKEEMTFERRWEKVQAVFVARGRRGLRPV